MRKKMRKGSIQAIAVGVLVTIITLAIGIIVFGHFQNVANDVVADLNNTEATNAYNTATNITWTGFTLLAVGVLALVGFGIVRIFGG